MADVVSEKHDPVILANPQEKDYESIKEGRFVFQVHDTITKSLLKHKDSLETFIVNQIGDCDDFRTLSWIYLSAYLKYESAIPVIKNRLVTCDLLTGLDSDYGNIDAYFADIQYPFHMAMIRSIERISGKSIHETLALSTEEKEVFATNASNLDSLFGNNESIGISDDLLYGCASCWLLNKIEPESSHCFVKPEGVSLQTGFLDNRDLDGDGKADKIDYDYTGGGHCCYKFKITLTTDSKTREFGFDMDGGYVRGIDDSQPNHFNIKDFDDDGLPEIFIEIETYNGELLELPYVVQEKYGISTNYILIDYMHGELTVKDFPKPE